MTIFMGILVLLARTGNGSTVRHLPIDGLRRIPTRRMGALAEEVSRGAYDSAT